MTNQLESSEKNEIALCSTSGASRLMPSGGFMKVYGRIGWTGLRLTGEKLNENV